MIFRRDRVDELFMRRFEPDGADFLFRASPREAPVRVAAAEAKAEARVFRRGVRYLGWGLVVGTVALVSLLVLLDLDRGNASYEQRLTQGLGGVFCATFVGVWWWLWRSPNRRFERRPPAGPARTDDELRVEALRSLSWSNLGVSAAIGSLLVARALDGEWLLPAVGGITFGLAVVGAVRKLGTRQA